MTKKSWAKGVRSRKDLEALKRFQAAQKAKAKGRKDVGPKPVAEPTPKSLKDFAWARIPLLNGGFSQGLYLKGQALPEGWEWKPGQEPMRVSVRLEDKVVYSKECKRVSFAPPAPGDDYAPIPATENPTNSIVPPAPTPATANPANSDKSPQVDPAAKLRRLRLAHRVVYDFFKMFKPQYNRYQNP